MLKENIFNNLITTGEPADVCADEKASVHNEQAENEPVSALQQKLREENDLENNILDGHITTEQRDLLLKAIYDPSVIRRVAVSISKLDGQ